jgi:hypothetical protein
MPEFLAAPQLKIWPTTIEQPPSLKKFIYLQYNLPLLKQRIMWKSFLFVAFLLPIAATAQKGAQGKNNEIFGASFQPKKVVSYDQLPKLIEGKEKIEVKVRGTVEDVCQAKGCWMNIVSSKTDEKMMVQFKDYGFFMPKDIAGREVIMDGYAFYEVTPVDELRHYAEDAGKTPEEIALITAPARKLKFLATGVMLVKK